MIKQRKVFIHVIGKSARARILFNLGLVTASLIFAIVTAEITLRLIGYSAPIFRRGDPELGWTLYPGMEGMHRRERTNYLSINKSGFNDTPREIPKPPDTFRVAVLGDSFTEAAEVPRERNFCSLTEEALAAHLASRRMKTEVLNFGVVGYGLSQQLLQLRKTVWAFEPDIVVLAIYLGNDISDNHYRLAESIREARPYFQYQGGLLKRIEGFPDGSRLDRERMLVDIVNRSRLLQLVKEAGLRRHGWRGRSDQPMMPIPEKNDEVYRQPHSKDWIEAWEVSEELISQISREVQLRGKPFLLMTIPSPIRVYPQEEVRRDFARQLGVNDLDYPDRRIAELARDNAIPLLQLAPELVKTVEAKGVIFYGFDGFSGGTGHWNERGHSEVAGLLAGKLKQMIVKTEGVQ